MIKHLTLPIQEKEIMNLRVGDSVAITGMMMTARDEAHKWLISEKQSHLAPILKDSFIYHCGPVIKETNGEYSFIAAGPTTSIREELYESQVIQDYQIRGVIGKGGMGLKTLNALQKYKAVYLHAIGGAAPLLAKHINLVKDVYMLEEFGVPEALWHIQVNEFPAIVTMDSFGNSLHELVEDESDKQFKSILDTL